MTLYMDSEAEAADDMQRIRVLLAGVPVTLYETAQQVIGEQPDIQLLGNARDRLDVLFAVSFGVDVLVLEANQLQPPPGICSHLLAAFPHLRILIHVTGGEDGILYWLGIRQRALPGLSNENLIDGIRIAHGIDEMS